MPQVLTAGRRPMQRADGALVNDNTMRANSSDENGRISVTSSRHRSTQEPSVRRIQRQGCCVHAQNTGWTRDPNATMHCLRQRMQHISPLPRTPLTAAGSNCDIWWTRCMLAPSPNNWKVCFISNFSAVSSDHNHKHDQSEVDWEQFRFVCERTQNEESWSSMSG